jgi:hypothetical protein
MPVIRDAFRRGEATEGFTISIVALLVGSCVR